MLSEANNAFACDLYRQLAAENSGDNLFFSPYSVFAVLAMCAEGARGTTAEELGYVLRFPKELRRSTQEDTNLPWNLGPLHAGISALNSLMRSDGAEDSVPGQVKESRMKLWHLSKRTEEAEAQGDHKALQEIAEETKREQVRFDRLKARTDPNVFHSANSLWGEQTCPFRREYVEVIERHYQKGGISPVDFKQDAGGATRLINDWVEEQTNRRITDLIPVGLLGQLTRLVLVNAIYFKGKWASPFDPDRTRPVDFTFADGSTRQAPMMINLGHSEASYAAFNGDGTFFPTPHSVMPKTNMSPLLALLEAATDAETVVMENPVGRPGYPSADGFAMLDIPYKAHRLSMTLIAPNRHNGLPAIEQRLSEETLAGWMNQLDSREVHVVLPKFHFDTGYQMTDSLKAMGVRKAFMNPLGDGGADFGGMTVSNDPEDLLYISEVLHKAFVEVNEKGTEAAASTADLMEAGAALVPVVPFIPTFKADRPFICIIRERPTGTILFMGRVMDPG